MSAVLVKTSNTEELNFLLSLLDRLKMEGRVVEEEQMEDLGLLFAMQEVDRSEKVPKSDILNKLLLQIKSKTFFSSEI
ncbi:MAG: hypothetical protein AAGI49_01450 [Bacteroidota bacterium]